MLAEYSYEKDGIEVAKSILSSSAVELLSGKVAALLSDANVIRNSITVQSVAQRKPHKVFHEIPGSEPDYPFIIGDLISLDEGFANIFMGLEILEHVATKLDVVVDDVVFHFSNLTSKPAKYGPEITAHRDFPNRYFCPISSDFIRVLIPIEQMTEKNGGLYFVRSSHSISDQDARRRVEKKTKFDSSKIEFIDAEPGDLVLLNSKTLHGSFPNISDQSRSVLIVQYGIRNQEYSVKANEFMAMCTRSEIIGLQG